MNLLQAFIVVVTFVGLLVVALLAVLALWVIVEQAFTRRRNNRKWREITAARHAVSDAPSSGRDRRAA